MSETKSKVKTTIKTKTTKPKTKTKTTKITTKKAVPKVETKRDPPARRLMSKVDSRIMKYTNTLIDTIQENMKLMSAAEAKEKNEEYRKDLEDYLGWLKILQKDLDKFSRWGKG